MAPRAAAARRNAAPRRKLRSCGDPRIAAPTGGTGRSGRCDRLPGVRVCLAYDCLYPYTVGGAERWYRNLAERLAADGHEVTYLTRRQWNGAEPPDVAGVRVVGVSAGGDLY